MSFSKRRQHPCQLSSTPHRPRRPTAPAFARRPADTDDRDPAPERRDPQADVAARGQPGAREPAQPQVGVPSRARDPRALSRHEPQRHRAAARRWAAAVPARVDRHPRAARRCAAGGDARAAGVRERPSGRRPARQPGAGADGAGGRSDAAPRDPQHSRRRRRRRRPHLHLRAGAAVAAVPRRARGRARLPQRSQLRPHDEVLRRRRIDAGAGAEDAVAASSPTGSAW